MEKQIKFLKGLIQSDSLESLEASITMVDFESIAEKLLESADDLDLIHDFIEVVQFIEEDTPFDSVISDESYDKLVDLYQNLSGKTIVGVDLNINSNRPMLTHKYPELVGTLGKCHFIKESDIPNKDSRHSLEAWINKVIKSTTKPNIKLFAMYKYDGLSVVLECDGKLIKNAVTRRDTGANVGLDVSHIFRDINVLNVIKDDHLPNDLFNHKFGIKTECMMTEENFILFQGTLTQKPKNRRSAVTKIINTMEESYNPGWVGYLTLPVLQLSVEDELVLNGNEQLEWVYLGKINGKYQYVNKQRNVLYDGMINTNNIDIDTLSNEMSNMFDNMIKQSESDGTPIDGCVFTIEDLDIINAMGRNNNVNKFQIAYKFPAGVKKTVLKKVEFPVGPIAGTITPLAIVEPVVINGATITHVGLSNYAKLDRLNLHIGDEVMIKYDIVPKMFIDETCIKSNNPKIEGPLECPVCGKELAIKDGVARCVNYDCDSKLVGKISNYLNKIGVFGIGTNTVMDLVNYDVINSIPDLYRIKDQEFKVTHITGYGKKSFDNMVKAIHSRLVLYPHELLGSLGIPDIGRRIMKKICESIPIKELLSVDNPDVIDKMTKINGIGDITAEKICEGILRNIDTIEELLHYIELKPYEVKDIQHTILFTMVKRDKEFERYLMEQCNCDVAGSFTKKVDLLVAGGESNKTTKAKEDGIQIISMDEAKKMFNYI